MKNKYFEFVHHDLYEFIYETISLVDEKPRSGLELVLMKGMFNEYIDSRLRKTMDKVDEELNDFEHDQKKVNYFQ